MEDRERGEDGEEENEVKGGRLGKGEDGGGQRRRMNSHRFAVAICNRMLRQYFTACKQCEHRNYSSNGVQ